MIRPSGIYVVSDGRAMPVTALGEREVWVEDDDGRRSIDLANEPEIIRIVTTARWHGAAVDISGVRGDSVGVLTTDPELAAREGLAGDQYGGWHGEVPLDEFSDVLEKVRPVPGRTG